MALTSALNALLQGGASTICLSVRSASEREQFSSSGSYAGRQSGLVRNTQGLGDQTCAKALRNLAAASAGSGARAAWMALVVPDFKADIASAAFDMRMFVDTRGSRERMLDEWHRLFAPSGGLLEEVVGLQTVGWMLVLKSMDSA